MKFYISFLLGCQLSAILALPVAKSSLGINRVLYFLDNDAAGNSIVSAQISNRDGTLSSAVKTPTGGNGLPQLAAVSQDSVVVSGNYLFNINAGSNTVSLFGINPSNPLHPYLIGEPAPSLGHIPVSVTYSQELNMACVVNGGDVAGVACFSVDSKRGLRNLGPLRSIPQPPGAAPPPVGPLIITGDITFDSSSSALFTTVMSANGGPGSLYAYPVIDRQVSHTLVNNTVDALTIPFSLNFLGSDNKLIVTNPHNGSPGAALLDISPSLQIVDEKLITIPGQEASCWVAEALEYDTLFIMDAARPTITIVDSRDGAIKGQFSFETPAAGAMDTKVDRNTLYTITDPFASNLTLIASPQILVYDITSVIENGTPKQIQSFDIFSEVGQIPDLMGLAIYPAID